jgi:RNA polymerase sigma-70 factor (ECF subfamily)
METIFNQYYPKIKSFIRTKIDDELIVEEIGNDVMMVALNSTYKFQKKSSFYSWLCGIAKHKVVDYYRKKKIKTILFSISPYFEEIEDKALSPEKDCLKNELKKEIYKTFLEIKKDYYKILRLKYIEGLSIKKIAQIMKTTVKAIDSKLMRARFSFKKNWNYDKKKN